MSLSSRATGEKNIEAAEAVNKSYLVFGRLKMLGAAGSVPIN